MKKSKAWKDLKFKLAPKEPFTDSRQLLSIVSGDTIANLFYEEGTGGYARVVDLSGKRDLRMEIGFPFTSKEKLKQMDVKEFSRIVNMHLKRKKEDEGI